MPFNSETGRLAGLKNKRGVSKERAKFDEVGEYLLNKGAHRMIRYLNKIKDDKEHFEQVLQLLNYFKPRMQAQTIQSRSEILIKVVNPKDDQGNTIDITEEL